MPCQIKSVVVVGAGPVGLLAALMLAQKGIHVEVIEAEKGIDQRPRGIAYGPAGVKVLHEAGIVDKLRERGYTLDSIGWRAPGGKLITYMSGLANPTYPNAMITLPVHLLAELLRDEFVKLPGAVIHWGNKVTKVAQDEEAVYVTASEPDGAEVTYTADFVIGGDGAGSVVRKSLFGREFPGHTWDSQLIATNFYYDALDQSDWSDLNFIVSREDWGIVVKIDEHGQYRVAYGTSPDLTLDQLKEEFAIKMERILPGHPKRNQYRVTNFAPYRIHQRCAEHMRVGRVLLAGDAAHITNPMGGLGLTSGVADVGGLLQCLLAINEGQTDMAILDKWEEMRRERYHNFTSAIASENLRRLWQDPETALDNDSTLQHVEQISKSPEQVLEYFAKQEDLGSDMTPFIHSTEF